jgi:hypothetical protein
MTLAGTERRFDVELLVIHPTMTPEEISVALGLEAHFSHCVGMPRQTPKGSPLPGNYRDTRWRHSTRHVATDQWFAKPFAAFVVSLMPRKGFLHSIRASGGEASVIIQFLCDGYHGDSISPETLAQLAELGVDLGLEIFSMPQRN